MSITNDNIGNACSKLMSIADILRRKLKDLYQQNNSYSRKYIAKYESNDVIFRIINIIKFNKKEICSERKGVQTSVFRYFSFY